MYGSASIARRGTAAFGTRTRQGRDADSLAQEAISRQPDLFLFSEDALTTGSPHFSGSPDIVNARLPTDTFAAGTARIFHVHSSDCPKLPAGQMRALLVKKPARSLAFQGTTFRVGRAGVRCLV